MGVKGNVNIIGDKEETNNDGAVALLGKNYLLGECVRVSVSKEASTPSPPMLGFDFGNGTGWVGVGIGSGGIKPTPFDHCCIWLWSILLGINHLRLWL